MIKKLLILIVALLIMCAACFCTVSASVENISDEADLLTKDQEAKLSAKLDEISDEYGCLVTVATMDFLTEYGAQSIARNVYEEKFAQRSESGIILLVSMSERVYGIYCQGDAESKYFTSSKLDELEESVTPFLSKGDLYGAFDTYADKCGEFINSYHTVGLRFGWIVTALIIGVAAAFITVFIMKSQLKSVRYRSEANNYLKAGSFNLNLKRDIFLYFTITRTPKPQAKSSSGGSSGGSGRSGSF